MTGYMWFTLGVSAGLFIGAAAMWQMNNRWYRKAKEVATAITNDLTAVLRLAADNIPDKDLSDALKAEADKCDEVWRS